MSEVVRNLSDLTKDQSDQLLIYNSSDEISDEISSEKKTNSLRSLVLYGVDIAGKDAFEGQYK